MTETARPLSVAQRTQLLLLLRLEARNEESAATVRVEPRLNPGVLSKLWSFGFTHSRTTRRGGGSQRTIYWLSATGIEAARLVEKECR